MDVTITYLAVTATFMYMMIVSRTNQICILLAIARRVATTIELLKYYSDLNLSLYSI